MELVCKHLLKIEGEQTTVIHKGVMTASCAQGTCVRCSLRQFEEVCWEAWRHHFPFLPISFLARLGPSGALGWASS